MQEYQNKGASEKHHTPAATTKGTQMKVTIEGINEMADRAKLLRRQLRVDEDGYGRKIDDLAEEVFQLGGRYPENSVEAQHLHGIVNRLNSAMHTMSTSLHEIWTLARVMQRTPEMVDEQTEK